LRGNFFKKDQKTELKKFQVERKSMDMVKLLAMTRNVYGRKLKKNRAKGLIPAVIYGREVKNESLWIDQLEFSRLLKKSGESTMINLKIDDKEGRNVIIYEIQRDPVSGKIIHSDFFQVKMDEEIETEVELVYVGESPAVKELGGVLVKSLDEVTVKCLPADLPSEINVDISKLKNFDDYIYVKDLPISSKIKLDLDPETVVALVSPPRTEEELEGLSKAVEEDISKVEGVEKKEDSIEKEKEGKENK